MHLSSRRRLAGVALAVMAGLASTARAGAAMPQAFGPGHCGPISPAYAQGATESGGQLWLLSPSEIATAGPLMYSGDGNQPVLLRASDSSPGKATSLPLPVDDSIQRLVVSAMFDGTGGTLDVTAPDGAAVAAGQGVVDTRLNCGRVITIERPVTGVWHASLTPSGQFWLVVHAASRLDLRDARFVDNAAAEPGTASTVGHPIAGRPATLRAEVSGAMRSPEFVLLSEAGQPLGPVTLSRLGDGDTWEGTFDLPATPFRLAVTGVDESGTRYQRSSKLPLHAELVEVRAAAAESSLRPGSESQATFTIRNAGPAARYKIVAYDGHGLVSRVEPATLDLGAGSEQQTTISLRVPADMAAGTDISLIVTATSDAPRPTSNAAVMQLHIRQ